MHDSQTIYEQMRTKADEIEAEMRRVGLWGESPPPPEAFDFKRAFAGDTMAFPQWIQFVFLPRVRDIAARAGETPTDSMVGAYAVREMDGDDRADRLTGLLCEFDALFGRPTISFDAPPRRRLHPALWVLAWTVLMAAGGVLFAAYAHRLTPEVRQEFYSFSAHDPASDAYESVQITASGAGKAGGEMQMGDAAMRVLPPRRGGEFFVDLPTLTFRYDAPDGQRPSGPITAEAVGDWLRRSGIDAAPSDLAPEAKALVDFLHRLRDEPRALRAALSQPLPPVPAAAPTAPVQFAAGAFLERDRPRHVPLWIRLGAPIVVWSIGLAFIAWRWRRRA